MQSRREDYNLPEVTLAGYTNHNETASSKADVKVVHSAVGILDCAATQKQP